MDWRAALYRCLPVALILSGCAPDSEEAAAMLRHALASTQASAAMTGAAANPAAAPSAAVLAAPPGAPPGAPLARVATALPAPGAPRLRGGAPPAAAASLLGVGADQLRRLLGEPSIRRAEGPAEVWLYEAPACRLDVILYADGAALSVGHAAARASGGGEGVTEAACLAAIAAAPAPAPWTAPRA